MSAGIKQWVQSFQCCQVPKDTGSVPQSFVGHLLASQPSEIVFIDFTLSETSQNRLESDLVITDVLNKYPVAVPTRDRQASSGHADRMALQVWCSWSHPFLSRSKL